MIGKMFNVYGDVCTWITKMILAVFFVRQSNTHSYKSTYVIVFCYIMWLAVPSLLLAVMYFGALISFTSEPIGNAWKIGLYWVMLHPVIAALLYRVIK